MQQCHVKLQAITHSAIISQHEQGQRCIIVTSLLLMQQGHMKPQLITCSAMISHGKKGQQCITATSLLLLTEQWHMKLQAICHH